MPLSKKRPSQHPQLPNSAPLLKVYSKQNRIWHLKNLHGYDQNNQGCCHLHTSSLHLVNTVIWSVVFFTYPLGCIWFFSQIHSCCDSLAHLAYVPFSKESSPSSDYASNCLHLNFWWQALQTQIRFCLEYTCNLIPKHPISFSFCSFHNLELKQQRKKKRQSHSPYTHSPNSPTDYVYLSETLSSLLSLDNKLSHLPSLLPISFHGSQSHHLLLSCSVFRR